MARDNVDPVLAGFFIIICFIIYVIYIVVQWIIANWIIVLLFLIIAGSIGYLIYYYVTEKEKKEAAEITAIRQRRQNKVEAERLELEIKEREYEEQRRIELQKYEEEQLKKQRDFEDQQKRLGLSKFIDRFGVIKWGKPDEIKIWKKEDEEAKIRDLLINRIVECIKKFQPIRKWEYEDGYHKELLGYLKHDFPYIKYEFQTGSSRPDLVIGNVAIEIKGPTDNSALDTLTTKCLKYSKYYDHLIMVLFNPQFSEKHFKEIKEGIDEYFPHVVIIRK